MTGVSMLFVGFLLGMKHATEADHLAAVATLATQRGSWLDGLRQGAAWGLGHTLALLLFGGIVLALGRSVPPKMGPCLELGVGFMLVVLGADVLRRLWRQRIHFHVHAHGDGVIHVHAHAHVRPAGHKSDVPLFSQLRFVPATDDHRQRAHTHPHAVSWTGRAVLIGVMHGMAGSAALIVLSLAVAPSIATGLLYIAMFGIGSMLGMALLSTVIALPLRASAAMLAGLHRTMTGAVGLFSLGLGVLILYRVGVTQHLLFG